MEGYYDWTLFHRVVKGFLCQGGDPNGDGTGGQSIWGEDGGFGNEYHPRLKFRYRGLLGMACRDGDDKTGNGSQFFITFDRADGLNGKATMFGRVTGPTIWNLMRIAELEVDEEDRPLEPPYITGTEVVHNPFDDIRPRPLPPREPPAHLQPKEPKKKGTPENKRAAILSQPVTRPQLQTKHKALLSFGEEDEEENEKEDDREKSKIMSAHDISGDQKLGQKVAQVSENKIEQLKSRIRRLERKEPSADLPPSDQKVSLSDEQGADVPEGDDEAGASVPAQAEVTATAGEDTAETARRDDLIEEAYKMRRGEGGKIRQAGLGSEARNKQQADLLDDNERGGSRSKLLKFKRGTAGHKKREADAMAALSKFQDKMRGQMSKEDSWISSEGLHFQVDSSNAYAYDAAKDSLMSYDPLKIESKKNPQTQNKGR